MHKNLPRKFEYVGYFFGINVTTIIYLVLRINFVKIYTDSEIVISMTLLFSRMLSLVKRFH